MRGSHKVQSFAKVFSGHHVNGFLAGWIHVLGLTCVPDSVDKPSLVIPRLLGIPAPTVPALIFPETWGWRLGILCDLREDLIGPALIWGFSKGKLPAPSMQALSPEPFRRSQKRQKGVWDYSHPEPTSTKRGFSL